MPREQKRRMELKAEVSKDGATVKIELPFVVGYLSDLGRTAGAIKSVAERVFTEITKDGETSFEKFLASSAPVIKVRVPNEIGSEPAELEIELTFRDLLDFTPDRLAERIGPLAELLKQRRAYLDLLDQIEGKEIETVLDARISTLKNAAATAAPSKQ